MKPIAAHRPDTVAAHQSAVEKVVRHMKANLVAWDADLSLDTLAREGCYSKSHFLEIFEQATGATPHCFLASLRVQKAKDLLCQTNHSVTEIALEVGYQSFPTFSRHFAELVGVPPTEFRKAIRVTRVDHIAIAARVFLKRLRALASGAEKLELAPEVDLSSGPVFVGLFKRGIPQGHPISGTVVLRCRRFCLSFPSETSFPIWLLAVQLRPPLVQSFCQPNCTPSQIASVRLERSGQIPFLIRLRPATICDPPLVIFLPTLLTGQFGETNVGENQNSG